MLVVGRIAMETQVRSWTGHQTRSGPFKKFPFHVFRPDVKKSSSSLSSAPPFPPTNLAGLRDTIGEVYIITRGTTATSRSL